MSSGQVTLDQVTAIKTILLSRDVYFYDVDAWRSLKIDPTSAEEYNNMVDGYEFDFSAIIGRKDPIPQVYPGEEKPPYTPSGLVWGIMSFVNSFYADYLAIGVILTSSGDDIIFTAQTPGVPFTGASSIVNQTGDVTGTLPGAKQTVPQEGGFYIANIVMDDASTSGTMNVTCKTVTKLMTFDNNLEDTLFAFYSAWIDDYAAIDIEVSYHYTDGHWILKFTEAGQYAAIAFNDVAVEKLTGDLFGWINFTTLIDAAAQVTKITASGTSGTALITVNELAKTLTVT
jgi:hypothetical protein